MHPNPTTTQRTRLERSAWPADTIAAITVLFLAVPQGLAYATIAGLPPAVGLYAAAIPTVIASIFRSSPHVISGPTNALSLLVGAAVASQLGANPVHVALTLALIVGALQVSAGVLRLGAIVDFISAAVVLGYITGAGVLIGVGQLYNATGTSGPRGKLWVTLGGWFDTLGAAQPAPVAVALTTVAIVVGIRLLNRVLPWHLPSAIVAMLASIVFNVAFSLEARGLAVVSDLARIPSGLPPLTLPRLDLVIPLMAVAIPVAVLSLVESTSVARALASKTGRRLDASTEFLGQGLSNLSAAFFGGYPVSGSLSRSALNERVGAKTRMAGVLTGGLMIVVLLAFGPLLDHTPLASLAGLMFVVSYDLVDVPRIRGVVRSSRADALAFAATLVATWVLTLDAAIYLGVGISLVLFLRRARLLRVVGLVVDTDGALEEHALEPGTTPGGCRSVRILQVEGSLFFGAAGELQSAILDAARPASVRVVVVRLKRAHGLDATTAATLADTATLFRATGKHLILAGMTPEVSKVLESSGAAEAIGRDNLFATRPRWFSALGDATRRATELCDHDDEDCPLFRLHAAARVSGG